MDVQCTTTPEDRRPATADLSVVLSTYNRGALLKNALDRLLLQETSGIDYEILIVDNNSSDDTKQVVLSYIERDVHFRYIFEPRQGLSFARNAGIAAARSDLIVFCDDDVEVSPTWLQKNYDASVRFPEADYIGGRVLPIWSGPVPAWVKRTMAPFALSDLGDDALIVSPAKPHCLVGASLAVRRRALTKAGLFSIETQRVKNEIGSTEDFDWQIKVWAYGGHGVYVPDIVCKTEVPRDRLSKSYHRRWHLGHGKFNAIARRPQWDGDRRLLGVPAFMYRQALEATFEFVKFLLRGKRAEAFESEMNFLFYVGFVRHRWKIELLGTSGAPATEPY
jgi:glycosyltransferase involved in cell wall biosynthesis